MYRLRVEEHISLAPMTTFGIGGLARYFARIRAVSELQEAQAFALDRDVPLTVLGGGSNVLIADEDVSGLVVKIELRGISREKISDAQSRILAAAGESWDAVVGRSIADGLWGIENLSGIPGTVGGAIVQNIGAYGAAISEVVEWVDVWNSVTGELQKLSPSECAFGYRDSAFKHNDTLIVIRAALKLSKDPAPNLTYRDLTNLFADRTPALPDIREAVLTIRNAKFPDLSREGSAGSYFKNLILPAHQAEVIKRQYPDMPLFPIPETDGVKVPLAWLLDRVLHLNGWRLGRARLFERQPIVLVADRGAHAADVRALAEVVRKHMRDAFGIEIEEEVKIIC